MLLDDTQIQLTGRWAFHINPIIPNQFHSFHATNHTGDHAALNFTGNAIEVFGLVGPANGNYTVQLDDVTRTFSGQASTTQQASLFSQQALDESKTHQLIITNVIEGRLLTVNLLNITQSQSTGLPSSVKPGISRGAIIAIALVASFCAIILAGSLAYLLLRRRRRLSALERRRRADESFKPRMRPLVLPRDQSVAMEERYPWMRDGNVTLAQLSRPDLARDGQEPYDPYPQRTPPSKPTDLAPITGDSDDDVIDVVPRTREELEALRPRFMAVPPPSGSPNDAFGSRV